MTDLQRHRQPHVATTVERMLESKRTELTEALAKGVDADRLVRVCLGQIRTTPKLGKCSAQSLASSIMQAGKLGLEPGLLGQCYLVPYGQECTLILGYRGLVKLALRSGRVAMITARVVYSNDVWHVEHGLTESFRHVPKLDGDRGEPIAAYAIATLANGMQQPDYMLRNEIEAIRKRSRAGSSGPWKTDTMEMWKKTAVRRLVKLLDLDVDTEAAIGDTDQAEFGGFVDARNESGVMERLKRNGTPARALPSDDAGGVPDAHTDATLIAIAGRHFDGDELQALISMLESMDARELAEHERMIPTDEDDARSYLRSLL